LNIYDKKQRWKFLLLFSAVMIGAGSLYYTNRLVRSIAEDEHKKIELWAEATRILANPNPTANDILFPLEVIENNTQIPVILVDEKGGIMAHRNLDSTKVHQQRYLMKSLEKIVLYSVLVVLIFSVGVYSANYYMVYVNTGDYLDKMSEDQKYGYITGLYEGIGLGIEEEWYLTLTKKMGPDQTQKIFEKYLEDHPEKLHLPASYLFRESLKEAYEKLH